MRRFQFTLRSVLVVKQKLLEDQRLELAKALRVVEEQQNKLNLLEKTLVETNNEIENLSHGSDTNLSLIDSYISYSRKIVDEITAQKEKLKQANVLLKRQQDKVKEAYINVKTLEKLKEKQKQEYDKQCLDEEIKISDDIVSSRRIAV